MRTGQELVKGIYKKKLQKRSKFSTISRQLLKNFSFQFFKNYSTIFKQLFSNILKFEELFINFPKILEQLFQKLFNNYWTTWSITFRKFFDNLSKTAEKMFKIFFMNLPKKNKKKNHARKKKNQEHFQNLWHICRKLNKN